MECCVAWHVVDQCDRNIGEIVRLVMSSNQMQFFFSFNLFSVYLYYSVAELFYGRYNRSEKANCLTSDNVVSALRTLSFSKAHKSR